MTKKDQTMWTELRTLFAEIRALNLKLKPLRERAESQRKAGVRGDGFVMRPLK